MINNVLSNNGILSMKNMGNGNAHGATGLFEGSYTLTDAEKRKRRAASVRILAGTSKIIMVGLLVFNSIGDHWPGGLQSMVFLTA
jgi:hypothetical protein